MSVVIHLRGRNSLLLQKPLATYGGTLLYCIQNLKKVNTFQGSADCISSLVKDLQSILISIVNENHYYVSTFPAFHLKFPSTANKQAARTSAVVADWGYLIFREKYFFYKQEFWPECIRSKDLRKLQIHVIETLWDNIYGTLCTTQTSFQGFSALALLALNRILYFHERVYVKELSPISIETCECASTASYSGRYLKKKCLYKPEKNVIYCSEMYLLY